MLGQRILEWKPGDKLLWGLSNCSERFSLGWVLCSPYQSKCFVTECLAESLERLLAGPQVGSATLIGQSQQRVLWGLQRKKAECSATQISVIMWSFSAETQHAVSCPQDTTHLSPDNIVPLEIMTWTLSNMHTHWKFLDLPLSIEMKCVCVYSGLTSLSTTFQSYHDGVWLRQGAQCSLL